MEEQVKSIVCNVINYNGDLENNDDLMLLGLDSFSAMNLAVVLELDLQLEFPVDKLHPGNFVTIEKIMETIHSIKI